MRKSNALAVNYSSSAGKLTQNNLLTDAQIREEWKCLVLPFPIRELAEIGGVSRQAADLWRKADRTVSSPALLNIGKSLPSVRRWIASHTDHSATDMSLDELMNGLHAVAAQNTADGGIARQMLAVAYSMRPQPAIPPVVREAWNFIDKRIEQDRERAKGKNP